MLRQIERRQHLGPYVMSQLDNQIAKSAHCTSQHVVNASFTLQRCTCVYTSVHTQRLYIMYMT